MTAIENEQQLDEWLSRPSVSDIEAVRCLGGDLLILGAGGKMGPTLALRARRAIQSAGVGHRVIAVARFSRPEVRDMLDSSGVETIAADLLDAGVVESLPEVPNIAFLAAKKFGTTGEAHLSWAINTWLPGIVARRYPASKMVVFSSGNIYPLVPITSGGATEYTPAAPVGEYAQSVLGRERVFEFFSFQHGTPAVILRLNYANELRYGVLLDIGRKVFTRRAVDVSMGLVNVIWQGDANSACLRSFGHCQSPPLVLNLTGPEMVSVRYLANEFGRRFGVDALIDGTEADTALVSNAARAMGIFGYPETGLSTMLDQVAHWIQIGGATLDKPTQFEARNGRF